MTTQTDGPPPGEHRLKPATVTGGFLIMAGVASALSLTTGPDGMVALPLVLAPLLALYWLSVRVRHNQAAGWLVFGGSFIIVAPLLMFIVEIATGTQVASGGSATGFGLLVLLGPLAQLGAFALLFLLVSLLAPTRTK